MQAASNNPEAPDLTVIMATPGRCATLNRPLRFLQKQKNRERIELILLGPMDSSFDDLDPALVAGFARCRTLAVGPIDEVERAFAPGIAAATAPVVALLENHVYPEPQWGEAVVSAYRGPWDVVGCVISNANLATATSWVEHLLSYVFHDELAPAGEVERVSRNNTTYRTEVLTAYGERLPDLLARDGGLMEELRRQGARFYREPQARMTHLNPSLTGSMLRLRLHSARASSSTRARTGGWSTGRRLAYVAASPLFPLLRIRALWPRLWSPPVRRAIAAHRTLAVTGIAGRRGGAGAGVRIWRRQQCADCRPL